MALLDSKKIAELQQRISELEGQVTQLTTEKAEFVAANGVLEARFKADEITIANLTTENGTLKADLETVRTELQAEKDGKETAISSEVTSRLAAAGVDPIKRDPKTTATAEKLTLAEFNKLSPAEQLAYCKAGRTLID